jgi:hypothetical protein
MIVYHGTGRCSLDGLLTSAPRRAPRAYLNWRCAFSTTTDFEIAALFAFRRSPPAALHDEREVGVVLEYEIAWVSREGKDWVRAEDRGVLQDEQEISIFKTSILELQAVHRLENSVWVRRSMNELETVRSVR